MQKTSSSHIHYHEVEQGSPEWHNGRKAMFTGSNAYKLLTSFGAGSWAQSQDSGWGGNFHTKRGHLLEKEAIELYERIREVTVGRTGYVTNDKLPNCLYSPDGFLPDRTIEVKCFSVKAHLAAIKALKLEILAQVHFGQVVMEKPLTDVILYNPSDKVPLDQKLVIIPVRRNRDIHSNFKRIIKDYNKRALAE